MAEIVLHFKSSEIKCQKCEGCIVGKDFEFFRVLHLVYVFHTKCLDDCKLYTELNIPLFSNKLSKEECESLKNEYLEKFPDGYDVVEIHIDNVVYIIKDNDPMCDTKDIIAMKEGRLKQMNH